MLAQLGRDDLPSTTDSTSTSRSARRWRTPGTTPRSFEHYAEGNRLRRSVIVYDAEAVTERVQQTKALFTPRVPRRRKGQRRAGPGPDLHRRPAAVPARLCSSRSCPAIPRSRARWSCPTSARSPASSEAGPGSNDVSAYPAILATPGPRRTRARSASATWTAPAIQRKTRRALLHRQECRTTGCTPA